MLFFGAFIVSTFGLMTAASRSSRSHIVDEIEKRRVDARQSSSSAPPPPSGSKRPPKPRADEAPGVTVKGCGKADATAPFLRPRDDVAPNAYNCQGSGVILRRDMGSVGVSSFQQVYGSLAADALGPRFRFVE